MIQVPNAVTQYDAYRSISMPTLLLDELLNVFSMFHNISHELVIVLRSDVIKVPTMRKGAPVGLQKELKIHHGLVQRLCLGYQYDVAPRLLARCL